MTTREHEDYRQSIGAYVLGALPELEAQAFERHLMGCQDCRQEVEELRVAAEALPRSVEPVEPPPELKQALMDIVWREAEVAAEPAVRSRRRAPFRLPRLSPALAWVSAAFLLAVGVAAGWAIGTGGGDGERTVVAQVDSERLPRASGELVVDEDEDGATLRLRGLPRPEPGRVLQAWVQRGDRVLRSTVFAVRADGTAVAAIPEDLEGVDRVMVTRERPGGARSPGEKPPVIAEL